MPNSMEGIFLNSQSKKAVIVILKKKTKKYDISVTKHAIKIIIMTNSIFWHDKFNGRDIFCIWNHLDI